MANLFLPAAAGAAQLICGDTAPVHAKEMHDFSNCSSDEISHTSHNDCSLGQICEQAVEDGLEKSTILNVQRENIIATLPVQQLNQNILASRVLHSLHLNSSYDSLIRDIHILNSTFLN